MSLASLREAMERGGLRPLDFHFAERLVRGLDEEAGELALAAAWVSNRLGDKDVCVDLGMEVPERLFAAPGFHGIATPDPGAWLEQLRACARVGNPGHPGQLVLDGSRLYLGRYWHYEQALAERLRGMAEQPLAEHDSALMAEGLDRLFPPTSASFDWQRLAAAVALLRPFSLVSGGPGTGKTHTVAAILALLLEQAAARGQSLRIALAAPTGKAAARLTESIRKLRERLPVDAAVREAIPAEGTTLHRLIGSRPGRVVPRHHAENPLHLDVLVIDEASMIDLPLMYRALMALPAGARLILLGDKDQLASVEAGSVFADLCGPAPGQGYSPGLRAALAEVGLVPPVEPVARRPLDDGIVLLRESRRFHADSGIGELARAVNRADAEAVSVLLQSGREDLDWVPADSGPLHPWLEERALEAFAPVLDAKGPEQALLALERFRILCALRGGPSGVEQVNLLVEQVLRREGLIEREGERYRGRPLMITDNDHGLRLFNGDVGILWPDERGDLRAWFRLPDNSIRPVLPTRLPGHETAFALTVHKSQGSEFERVLLLLPENDSRVLTRELIYTGITRAVRRVTLRAAPALLSAALQRVVKRASGLDGRLRVPDSGKLAG